jgi:hypothetical protein
MTEYTIVNVEDCVIAPYNPRIITAQQLSNLADSIANDGFLLPLVLNKRDGKLYVISGHQRLKVLKHRGVERVQALVLEVSLTEEMRLNIAHNKLKGDWDFTKLPSAVKYLADNAPLTNFRDLGFTNEEVSNLMVANDNLASAVSAGVVDQSLETQSKAKSSTVNIRVGGKGHKFGGTYKVPVDRYEEWLKRMSEKTDDLHHAVAQLLGIPE